MEGVMAAPELSPHYDSIRALVGDVVELGIEGLGRSRQRVAPSR